MLLSTPNHLINQYVKNVHKSLPSAFSISPLKQTLFFFARFSEFSTTACAPSKSSPKWANIFLQQIKNLFQFPSCPLYHPKLLFFVSFISKSRVDTDFSTISNFCSTIIYCSLATLWFNSDNSSHFLKLPLHKSCQLIQWEYFFIRCVTCSITHRRLFIKISHQSIPSSPLLSSFWHDNHPHSQPITVTKIPNPCSLSGSSWLEADAREHYPLPLPSMWCPQRMPVVQPSAHLPIFIMSSWPELEVSSFGQSTVLACFLVKLPILGVNELQLKAVLSAALGRHTTPPPLLFQDLAFPG